MQDAQRALRALGLGDRGLELALCENVQFKAATGSAPEIDPSPDPISLALRPGSVVATGLSILASEAEAGKLRPLSFVSEGLYRAFPLLPELAISEANFDIVSRLKLSCDKCRAMSLEPVTVHPCGHTLCRNCLDGVDAACPICGERVALALYDVPAITQLARSVLFRCGGSPNCDAKGPLAKVLRHMRHCGVVQRTVSESAWRGSASASRAADSSLPAAGASLRASRGESRSPAPGPRDQSRDPSRGGSQAAPAAPGLSLSQRSADPAGSSSRLADASRTPARDPPRPAPGADLALSDVSHGLSAAAASRLLSSSAGTRASSQAEGTPSARSGPRSPPGSSAPPEKSPRAPPTPHRASGTEEYLAHRVEELERALRQRDAEKRAAAARISALEDRAYRIAAEKERVGEIMLMSLRAMKRCVGEGEDAVLEPGKPDQFEDDLLDLMARSSTRPWEDGGDEEAQRVEESLRESRLRRSAARRAAEAFGQAGPAPGADTAVPFLSAYPSARDDPRARRTQAPISYMHTLTETSQGILAAAHVSQGCAEGVAASARLGGSLIQPPAEPKGPGAFGAAPEISTVRPTVGDPGPAVPQALYLPELAVADNAIMKLSAAEPEGAAPWEERARGSVRPRAGGSYAPAGRPGESVVSQRRSTPGSPGAYDPARRPAPPEGPGPAGASRYSHDPSAVPEITLSELAREQGLSPGLSHAGGAGMPTGQGFPDGRPASASRTPLSRAASTLAPDELDSLMEIGQIQVRMEQLRAIFTASQAKERRLRERIAGIRTAYERLSQRYSEINGEQ